MPMTYLYTYYAWKKVQKITAASGSAPNFVVKWDSKNGIVPRGDHLGTG